MMHSYQYKAEVMKVTDGDTIVVDIDLGFHVVIRNIPLRLARIDAYELRGDERLRGLYAKAKLKEMVEGKRVLISTAKKGSYNRYLAEVYYDAGDEVVCVNDLMVSSGHAVYV
jgi:endonuclease YncB( thermonuclease family)